MCINKFNHLDYLLVRFDCELGYIIGQYLCNDKNKNENIVILNSLSNVNDGIVENPSFNTIINVKEDDILIIGKENIIKFLNNQLQEIIDDIQKINDDFEELYINMNNNILIYNKNKEKLHMTDVNFLNSYKSVMELLRILYKNYNTTDHRSLRYSIISILFYMKNIHILYKGIKRRNKFQKRILFNIIDNFNDYIKKYNKNSFKNDKIEKNNIKLKEINNILLFLSK